MEHQDECNRKNIYGNLVRVMSQTITIVARKIILKDTYVTLQNKKMGVQSRAYSETKIWGL